MIAIIVMSMIWGGIHILGILSEEADAGAKVCYDSIYFDSRAGAGDGSPCAPVNNFSDLIDVCTSTGTYNVKIKSGASLAVAEDITGPLTLTFEGNSIYETAVHFDNHRVPRCGVENTQIDGYLLYGSSVNAYSCRVYGLEGYTYATFHDSIINYLQPSDTIASRTELFNCSSAAQPLQSAVIDVNGGMVNMVNCSGSFEIENLTGGQYFTSSILLDGGSLVLDETCTGGMIVLYGEFKLVNNSAGTTVIDFRDEGA